MTKTRSVVWNIALQPRFLPPMRRDWASEYKRGYSDGWEDALEHCAKLVRAGFDIGRAPGHTSQIGHESDTTDKGDSK